MATRLFSVEIYFLTPRPYERTYLQSNKSTDTMKQEAIDSALAATGSKATYGGSATMIGAWWLSSEFAFLVGMIVGVAGLLVQWYYRHKLTKAEIAMREEQNKREKEAHEMRMQEMRETAQLSRSKH